MTPQVAARPLRIASEVGLPTTPKNTLRPYATANTVFGRDRAARNEDYPHIKQMRMRCGPNRGEVVSFTEARNSRSRAVMERLGFRYSKNISINEEPFALYLLSRAAKASPNP
jgi:hypothetical protein